MPGPIELANGLRLRPLTARSIILSTLLGATDGEAAAGELVLVARDFGITDNALRAALSRMLSGGDVRRVDGRYRLTERLTARQRRQEQAVRPPSPDWDETWQVAVVTVAGRTAPARAELRKTLRAARLGELREGVWMRPANPGADVDARADILELTTARPVIDAATLVGRLWDLGEWAATAGHLADAYASARSDVDRFTVMAAVVRHLLADPALPPSLVPTGYPADSLQRMYGEYRAQWSARRTPDRATR